jgi:hypothetical protein
MTIKLQLHAAWSKRAKLWTEGAKLRAEGAKLRAEGGELRAEGAKLRAEGAKLRAEGGELWAKGDKLWAEAIIEVYGNIRISWSWATPNGECTLENGDVYAGDQGED